MLMRATVCLPLYTGMYLLSRNVIYTQVHIDMGDHYIAIIYKYLRQYTTTLVLIILILTRLSSSQNLKLVQETGLIMLLFKYYI